MRRGLLASGGRTLTPARLSNVILWLKASVGVTLVSGGVSRVEDLSGNGRHAVQTVAADRPTLTTGINGKPTLTCVVRSGGTEGQYLIGPDMLPWEGDVPRSLFVVYRSRALPPTFTGYALYAGQQGGGRQFSIMGHVSPATSPYGVAAGAGYPSGHDVVTVPILGEFSYDGTTLRLAKNALAYTTAFADVNMDGSQPYFIGARNHTTDLGTATVFGNIDVAEIIAMASQARNDEVARARAYLMGEYGIS